MPRSKEGVKRPPLDPAKLKEAVESLTCEENKVSFREASQIYNISIATLCRHVRAHKAKGSGDFHYESHLDVNRVFSNEEEIALVEYIKTVANMHYGLTKKGVRDLAYKYAIANKKKCPPNWEMNKIAGEEWMRHFMKRHGELSIRKPESTSLARASSFNKTNYGKFMDNLEAIHQRFGPIPPARIWNVDESGCSTVQQPSKIVAPKGIKQLGSTTSAERGQLVTIICAINATGTYLPPMLIFPRVHFKDNMVIGAPPGTLGSATPSGWSNEDQWLKFIKHFIEHTNASKDHPVLLLIDNSETHNSVEAIELASDNGIKIITFPPHTTNHLQPLDLCVFGPFKTFYNQAIEKWHLDHPGKTFNIYNVAQCVGYAHPLAFTPKNISSGFSTPGIYPFNRNAFSEIDFLPASVTDRPDPQQMGSSIQSLSIPTTSAGTSSSHITPSKSLESRMSTSKLVTPEEVQPYPTASPRKQRKRRIGTTRILTDTPEKEELRRKKEAKNKKTKKQQKIKLDSKKIVAKALKFDSTDEEDEDEPLCQDESDLEGKTLEEICAGNDDDTEDTEDELQPPYADDVKIDDHLLIKLAGKKTLVYYVGCVTKKITPREFEVSYLRHCGGNKFRYPSVPDIASIDITDVAALMRPTSSSGTERTKDSKTFNFPFYKYNVH